MTDESFLHRWSRLKRDTAREAEPETLLPLEATEAASEDGCAPRLPEAVEPSDMVELPRVESLGADSDYRPFLKPEVPETLRWAALRKAWSTDPAIADFRGFAEYDWDCNAPGFGQLLATDNVRELCDAILRPPADRAECRPGPSSEALAEPDPGEPSRALPLTHDEQMPHEEALDDRPVGVVEHG